MGYWSERQIEIAELGYNVPEGTICLTHVTDDYLRSHAGEPNEFACTFCGLEGDGHRSPFAVQLENLMPCFMDAFWSYYGRYDEAPRFEGETFGTEDTSTAVWDLTSGAFDEVVLDAVSQNITDAIVDPEVSTWYTRMDTEDLSLGWGVFAETTRHVSRFVLPGERGNRSPLNRVSGFLEQLLTYVEGEHNLVRTMPVGERVHRGRLVAEMHGKLPATAEELGPAPRELAGANRMSPAGIPMFYCSADPLTAVAEIAGHGVEPFAVIGAFVCQRELRILDLTHVRTRPSVFDRERRVEARILSFLDEFAGELSRPIIPDRRQHIEYAPTQVLTEFFRWAPTSGIDGIEMRSSQTGASTYVLFVRSADIREDSTLEGSPELPSSRLMSDNGSDGDELGPAFRFDSSEVTVYRINRRVEPEPAASLVYGTWVVTSARADE